LIYCKKLNQMPIFKSTLYFLLGLLLFTFMACKTTNKALVNQSIQKTMDTSKIMVLLPTGMKANVLEEEFKAYELKSKGLVSRRENRCLFTYNQSLVEANELLEIMKKSSNVLEANFPKIVHQSKVTN